MNRQTPARAIVAMLALFLPVGCAQPRPLTLQEPIGPAPRLTLEGEKHGTLVVYSAWERFGWENADQRYHEDFTLNDSNGAVMRKVRNHSGTFDEGPVPVSLPPGVYSVRARATGAGTVIANVVIKEGQVTGVHLDGSLSRKAGVADAHYVRLPDGQIVGWKESR